MDMDMDMARTSNLGGNTYLFTTHMADQVTARKDCPRGSVEAILLSSLCVCSQVTPCAQDMFIIDVNRFYSKTQLSCTSQFLNKAQL